MQLGAVYPQAEIGDDPGFIRHFGQAVEDTGFAYLTAFDHILGAEASRFDGPVGGFPSAPYLIDDPSHEVFSLFSFLAGVTERIVFRPRVLILPQRSAVLAAFLALPALATATGVSVKFDVNDLNGSPFPSDRFTRPDWSQRTGRLVNLPKPLCASSPSDCADIDVINTLDGFNTQPRISVPFTGAIDLNSVNSKTVFLVNLGDTLSGNGFGQRPSTCR